jgi:hypothetical protein
MSTPVNGPGHNYTNQWAEVIYTPRTDTISLPDDTPITSNWAEAVTIPASETPVAPQKTSWSDEVKLPGGEAPKPSVSNWADSYEVVMPDPWKDRVPQGIPWMDMGTVFPVSRPNNDIPTGGGGGGGDGGDGGGGDPLVLDLNHDGKIGVTGQTTARDGDRGTLGRTVSFDLDGDGKKDEIEWLAGDGDGLLVDDRDGGATGAMLTNGEIDGKRLFGDERGTYFNGYAKLQGFDKDGDGKLTGEELDGLKVWVDDGDAKLEGGELKTLRELGITEISVKMHHEQNAKGETLERSSFVQDGQTHMTEDVWFGVKDWGK